MSTIIKIENLYKLYRIGSIGHGTLYRDIQSFFAKINGKEDPNSIIGFSNTNKNNDKILAINNLNLDIEEGKVLGIIGLNGAGKSTLLKLLSRVTSPTSGIIKIKGKVASLLEVGTGFHTELTGRENIFLNGSINGMNNREINKNLDEIVDFAGVEKYLDTPVKRYSSGMIVRLGFSVAAHLNPNILIVDEVLSVGDITFRNKAANKIKKVSEKSGRTVLFVSHNMDSIVSLCNQTIVLEAGEIKYNGSTKDSVNYYLKEINRYNSLANGEKIWNEKNAPQNDNVSLLSIRTFDNQNKIKSDFKINEDIFLEFDYELKNEIQVASSIELYNESGILIFVSQDDYKNGEWGKQNNKTRGKYKTIFQFPKNLFNEGVVFVGLNIYIPPGAANTNWQIKKNNIFSFKIIDYYEKESSRGSYPYPWGSPALRPSIESRTIKVKSNI